MNDDRWMACIAEQRNVQGVALADSAATSHVSNRTTSRDTSRKSFVPAAVDAGPEFSSSSSSSGSSDLSRKSRSWALASLLTSRRHPAAITIAAVALSVTSFVT